MCTKHLQQKFIFPEMFYQNCCPTLTVELWFCKFNVHVLSVIKKLEIKVKRKKNIHKRKKRINTELTAEKQIKFWDLV